MRYLFLILALAGCAVAPPVGGMTPPGSWDAHRTVEEATTGLDSREIRGVDFDFEAAGIPVDEPKYLLSDGLHQVQVRDGKIIASEPVPGGLPELEAELFEAASAR